MTFSSQHGTHCLHINSLQTLILNKIEQKNLTHAQIIEAMGYSSGAQSQYKYQSPSQNKTHRKALQRLQQVLTSPDLGLSQPSYDFKYSSTEFIHALCQVLGMDRAEYQPLLQPLEQYAHKVLHAIKPVVYADISFNDNFKPSFVNTIAMAKYTHVPLDEGIRLLDSDEQWQAIHQQIRQHYANYTSNSNHASIKGSIPFDGIIKGYRVLLTDANGDKQSLYIPADF